MFVLTHQLARSQPAVHNRVSKSDRDGELVDVKKACKERGRRTLPLLSAVPHVLQRDVPVFLREVRHDPARLAQVSQQVLEHLPCPRWIPHQPCLEARPPLTAAARRRGGIRPGRGDVAEAVTAAVAHSGTPAPAKGAFTAEKRPLTPSDLISDAGVILRLGHSTLYIVP